MVTNNAKEPRKISAFLSARSVYYTGINVSLIKKAEGTFVLQPKQSQVRNYHGHVYTGGALVCLVSRHCLLVTEQFLPLLAHQAILYCATHIYMSSHKYQLYLNSEILYCTSVHIMTYLYDVALSTISE